MRPCRGRRRCRRWISEVPISGTFTPEGDMLQERGVVCLTLEELEALRLVDLLDLDQEESAFFMGISRRAFWNDLMRARKKMATALVYGMTINIQGGSYLLRGGEEARDAEGVDQAGKSEPWLLDREIEYLQRRLSTLLERRSRLGEPASGGDGRDKEKDGPAVD